MSNAKLRWYVVQGQLKEFANLENPEVVSIVLATCYDEVIDMFKRDYPLAYCINADLSTEQTAKSYHIPYIREEWTWVREVVG